MLQRHVRGTAQRCGCHGTEVLAVLRPIEQVVEVRDRRNREHHMLVLGLADLVNVLDPAGTTYQRVGTT